MKYLQPHNLAFIILLGALSLVTPFSVDMNLPALPLLARDLGISAIDAAHTIGIFMLGYGMGPLFCGPMSDHFGRRPLLLFSLCLYVLASIGATFASGFSALIGFRLLQGLMAGAVVTMPSAIIRDSFEGKDGAKKQSLLTVMIILGPLLAPVIGAAILNFGNWRTIYGVLAGFAATLIVATGLLLPETLRHHHRSPKVTNLLHRYGAVLKDKVFTITMVCLSLNFAGMFAYISSSPVIFIQERGTDSGLFSLFFALTASGLMAGSWVNTYLIHKNIAPVVILRCATSIGFLAATCFFLLASTGHATVAGIIGSVVVFNLCGGLIFPTATHKGLENLANAAGSGSALLRSTTVLMGGISSVIVPLLGHHDAAWGAATVMIVCATCNVVIIYLTRHVLADKPDQTG
ncbi:MAG: multidrug effflux MFS transporter [Alphaproteobacteria bacterium]|nr:multidrug effflux MFS transporter [Alphaproteobacteria bacterium]MBV8548069.1 multidrug effflux MFS transporter [Alphaproteobacteria bacterium]